MKTIHMDAEETKKAVVVVLREACNTIMSKATETTEVTIKEEEGSIEVSMKWEGK